MSAGTFFSGAREPAGSELKGVPDRARILAHFTRGILRMKRGDRHGAIKDFGVVCNDPSSPVGAVQGAKNHLDQLNPLKSHD